MSYILFLDDERTLDMVDQSEWPDGAVKGPYDADYKNPVAN